MFERRRPWELGTGAHSGADARSDPAFLQVQCVHYYLFTFN